MFSESASGPSFISSFSWSPNPSTAYFPDPFMDMASMAMPQTIGYALRFCEYLMYANGTYFRAIDRVLSYFLTDVEITNVDDSKEKEKIADFLHSADGLRIMDELHIAGLNYMVYGNDFSSIMMPFKRYLSCSKPGCGVEAPLTEVMNHPVFKFKWDDFKFKAKCPRCKTEGHWQHIDRQLNEAGKVRIKHWSPHEMEILFDPLREDCSYIWKIPDEYKREIRKGTQYYLERANWEVIECVKNNTHLRFDDDVVYHMKESTLAGIRNRGWGISRVLANFRQAWYVQVLHRYNEAIALDYVIPFRLITPSPGPGSADQARDALLNMHMGGYMSQIQRMLRQHRLDPAMWHTLPFPVQYQSLGGDATQLAPRDLLDQGLEILLNNIGVPVELYKGTLQLQAAPPALRLFESSWSHLVVSLNGYLNFIMRKLAEFMSWDRARARLQKVTHADDMNRQMSKLQLMMGGQASKQTGLSAVGLNYFEEGRKQLEEQQFEADLQAKAQKSMQNAATMQQLGTPQTPGQPPAGGQPMPPGGAPPTDPYSQATAGMAASNPNQPQTVEEMNQNAQIEAQRLLAMPESQKDSELYKMRQQNKAFATLVVDAMEKARQQARQVGGIAVMQQSFGKA